MVAGATLLASGAASAQEGLPEADTLPSSGSGRRPFVVTPYLGWQAFDEASALRGNAAFGLDLAYRLSANLGIALSGGAVRPETDGEFFPLVRLGGDSSRYYRVSQRVTEYTYGVAAIGMVPMGRLTPYAIGGVGRYLFTMNPQATGATSRFGGPMFMVGGGVNMPLGARTGVTLDLRDVIFGSFERERLDATDPLFRDTRFDPVPAGKPEPKSTLHNIRLSIGVSFVPDSKERAR